MFAAWLLGDKWRLTGSKLGIQKAVVGEYPQTLLLHSYP
jgi:hypothetical protein